MEKYDGWVLKNKGGSLLMSTFARTRKEIIENYEGTFRVGNWGARRDSGDLKIVRVKLVEVNINEPR